jgi:hypothetical protein
MDERELRSILSELQGMPEALKKAEVSAVRRTTKTGKSKTSQILRKDINLKKDKVDSRIKLKMPSSEPVGVITISNVGFPLIEYGGLPKEPPSQQGVPVSKRRPRGGPSWKVFKKKPRVRGRNMFIQRDKRGQVHIMVRPPGGRGGRRATAPGDYRIKYGPGLVTAAREVGLEEKIVLNLTETLRKNLMSQVDRFLARKKKDR